MRPAAPNAPLPVEASWASLTWRATNSTPQDDLGDPATSAGHHVGLASTYFNGVVIVSCQPGAS